jgi:hypothetical protein
LVQFGNDVLALVASQGNQNVVFPGFSGVLRPPQSLRVSNSFTVAPTLFQTSSSSTYHSLQLQVRKAYSGGLLFGSAFTYSHTIDDASDFFDTAGSYALPQNNLYPSERASSNFDVRLRIAAYGLWDLPIRSGHKALGGWKLAGVLMAEGGQPYTVNSSIDVNRDGNLTDRLQTTAGLLHGGAGDSRVQLRIAPGVGVLDLVAPDGKDGAVGRNTFRAPPLVSLDASLTKSFIVRERHRLSLRWEAFNTINRVQFGIPTRILGAPGFGTATRTILPARQLQLGAKYSF